MGRTRPTFRDALDRIEADWAPFRRSLRRRHQRDFDRLFEHARGHADAAGQQNPADPWRGLLVAVLLAHERECEQLRERVAALEDRVAVLEEQVGTPDDGARPVGTRAKSDPDPAPDRE